MKNQKDPLKFKKTFFLIGINLALGGVLAIFNWSTVLAKSELSRVVESYNPFSESILIEEIKENQKIKKIEPKTDEIVLTKDDVADPKEIEPHKEIKGKFSKKLDSLLKKENPEEIQIIEEPDDKVYKGIDAQFIGNDIESFMNNNINVSSMVKELGLIGDVYLEFIVEKDGTISYLQVITPKERKMGYGVEEACLRVIKMTSGNWVPAQVKNKPVRALMRLPILLDFSRF